MEWRQKILAFREGVAEGGGWGEEFRHARAFRRAKRGGQVRFRFLDLCIRFGKMISKVREGFNLGASEEKSMSPRPFRRARRPN
jgi:hypothetical protein